MCIESHTFHYRSLKWMRYWMEEFVKCLVEKVRIIWSHFTHTLFSRACENTSTYSCKNSSYFMPCVSYFFSLYRTILILLERQRANCTCITSIMPRPTSVLLLAPHHTSTALCVSPTSRRSYTTLFVPGFFPARLHIR